MSLGAGIAVAGIWFGVAAMSFSGIGPIWLVVAFFAALATVAICEGKG